MIGHNHCPKQANGKQGNSFQVLVLPLTLTSCLSSSLRRAWTQRSFFTHCLVMLTSFLISFQTLTSCGKKNSSQTINAQRFVDITIEINNNPNPLGFTAVTELQNDNNFQNTFLNAINLSTSNADTFTLVISGCGSGFSQTLSISASSGTLRFYEGDTNCIVALRSFSWNSKTWTKSGGGDFSGVTAATFLNNTDGETLVVKQIKNLSSPVVQTDAVQFIFQRILSGDKKALISIGTPNEILGQTGEHGPYLKWFTSGIVASLSSLDASNIPTLRVKVECTGNWTWQQSSPETSLCNISGDSLEMSNVWAKLVNDTYANGSTLTQANASNLFETTPSATHVQTGNVFDASGTNSGGFQINVPASGDIAICRSYLLILMRENADSTKRSFTYFNVDMATSDTGC